MKRWKEFTFVCLIISISLLISAGSIPLLASVSSWAASRESFVLDAAPTVLYTKNVSDVGTDLTPYIDTAKMQLRIDYGNRTDSQPVYMGYAVYGVDNDTNGWLLYNYTYDAGGNLTYRAVGFGNWTNKTNVTY